ncbi:MAG: hypothetical protein Ct9H300mP19_05630 [Dehalococcoidia bacterium]|nr:MAG: hypothetical protein Ct9H300mP19_05630 [Dehalococcoidia bacterium]
MRRGLRQAIRGLDQHDATADVGLAVQAADSWISNFFTAIVFGAAAVLGILQVLGNNIDPAINYLKDFGAASFNWLVTDGLRIVLILFLSWVLGRVTRRAIPKLLSSIMLTQASAADHDEIMKRSETLSSFFCWRGSYADLHISTIHDSHRVISSNRSCSWRIRNRGESQ